MAVVAVAAGPMYETHGTRLWARVLSCSTRLAVARREAASIGPLMDNAPASARPSRVLHLYFRLVSSVLLHSLIQSSVTILS